MKNIIIVLIGLLCVFSSKFCAQVKQGDVLIGWFGKENKKYVGEVISVESGKKFTLKFSHSDSLYNFEDISENGGATIAKVISSKGGKYAKNELFSYIIFRDEAGVIDFLKFRFPDGKTFIGYIVEGYDKYYTVEMLHSGNMYKMGYNNKVYETGKGAYIAGTPFTVEISNLVDNSAPILIESSSKGYIHTDDKTAWEKFIKTQKKGQETAKKVFDNYLKKIIKAFEEANLKQ